MKSKIPLLLQVPASLVIIAFVPTNGGKLAAFLLLWITTFDRLTRGECIFYLGVCALFVGMNWASLSQGIFSFAYPDILKMPVYELFMWGFYFLHARKLLGGEVPASTPLPSWLLLIVFAGSFALIKDPGMLMTITGGVICLGLILHHERLDFIYIGYFIALGAAIEYVGVHSGQWSYPNAPRGGVPYWFITLWGGVGFLMRRCLLPLIPRLESQQWLNSRRS